MYYLLISKEVFMKKTILALTILITTQIYSETYNLKLNNKHTYNVTDHIPSENIVPESPDVNNDLSLSELTDSNHVLGAGWFLFNEGIQVGFTTLPQFELLKNSNHTQFTLYNDDNFYLTFNRSLLTRDGSNAHNQPYWNTSTASIINTNNLNVGNNVHYVNHPAASGLVFSNATSEPWCSPINGRFNGSCVNASLGKGDWKIYIK
jgi:hypothetical protein